MNRKRVRNVSVAFLLLFGYYLIVKNIGVGIPCLFRYFFQLPCPGCGITHMLMAAVRGDFREAYLCHPVIFCASPFLLWLIYRCLRGYLTDQNLCWRRWERIGIGIVLACLLIFWGVRIIFEVSDGIF